MRDSPFSSAYAPQFYNTGSLIEVSECISKKIDQPIYKIDGKYFIDTQDTLYGESKPEQRNYRATDGICQQAKDYFMSVVEKNAEEIKNIK